MSDETVKIPMESAIVLGRKVALVCGAGSSVSVVMREQIRAAMEAEEQRRRDEEIQTKSWLENISKGLTKSMYEHPNLIQPEKTPDLLATGPLNRKVQKKVKRQWIDVPFMDLTSGCTFRMFEENGTPVVDAKGHHEWIAACKPFIKEGTARINVYKGSDE